MPAKDSSKEPIKKTIIVEVDLREALEEILNNPINKSKTNFEIQGVVTVYYKSNSYQKEKTPVVSLYMDDKHAIFYEGFTNSAILNPSFKVLINYFREKDWETNLDEFMNADL